MVEIAGTGSSVFMDSEYPICGTALLEMERLRAEWHLSRATRLHGQGDLASALREYEAALAAATSGSHTFPALVRGFFAQLLDAVGEHEKASEVRKVLGGELELNVGKAEKAGLVYDHDER